MSSSSYSYSADFRYIDEALKSRWQPFYALEKEMKDFVPRPLSSYAEYRAKELDRLHQLNPDSTAESLSEFVDQQISFFASSGIQFTTQFDSRFITEYVTVALLSHALCEAIINAIIAIGLAHIGSEELFPLLERVDVKRKWQFGPKSFFPSWTFPKGNALYETLNQLTRQRNAMVHYKIRLEKNGTTILDGSGFNRKQYTEETIWLRRFFCLPYDLEDYANRMIVDFSIKLLFDRSPIEPAKAHAHL